MSVFDVLTMISGLCLFLFGMSIMGDGLERRAGFIWADLLNDIERTSDHCSNIAVSIIDAQRHNMNAHQSLRSMKQGDCIFFERLDQYSRKYSLPQD